MINLLPSPYLNWLFYFVWLPTIILWIIYWRILIKYRAIFVRAVLGALLFSIPWDILAYLTRIWIWPKGCCVGLRIAYLPIEEYCFLIFVTIVVVTVTLVCWNHGARRPYKR